MTEKKRKGSLYIREYRILSRLEKLKGLPEGTFVFRKVDWSKKNRFKTIPELRELAEKFKIRLKEKEEAAAIALEKEKLDQTNSDLACVLL